MRSYHFKLRSLSAWAVISLVACGLVAGAAPKTSEPNTPAKPPSGGVAVTVNGVPITEAQVEAEMAPQLEKMGGKLPPAFADQIKSQLRQSVLDTLVTKALLDEQVRGKIVVTDQDVDEQIKQYAARQQPPLSVGDFKALIEASGKTFDQWKQQMDIKRRLGYQKLFESKFAGKINVTEEDARKYYDQNPNQFKEPEKVRASHILIKPDTADPNADPNQVKAKAQAKAQDLLKQVRNGADFATLAKAHSACPSAKGGGDLNFFPKTGRGSMVPEFSKAAFAMKIGQVSDVVETQFGYHVIKVTDRKPARTVSFEEAKGRIIQRLTAPKQQEIAKEYINSLKSNAKIVYPPGKEPKSAGASASPKRAPKVSIMGGGSKEKADTEKKGDKGSR